ncbi:MAG TPA: hypothetical protein VHF69_00285 [Candidatus Synoicihabitans sp.]|nr:hypothetical protein [Candidatus Synoicihabitans sp.]
MKPATEAPAPATGKRISAANPAVAASDVPPWPPGSIYALSEPCPILKKT